MANLVRLHLDKDTGRIVAGGEVTQTGGAPAVTKNGFLFTQSTASGLWTIDHFAGTTLLLVQVFDTGGNLIIPDNIHIVDINTIEVSFGTPATGTARIVFFTV